MTTIAVGLAICGWLAASTVCALVVADFLRHCGNDPEPDVWDDHDLGPDCDELADQPVECLGDAEVAYRFHQIIKRHTWETYL